MPVPDARTSAYGGACPHSWCQHQLALTLSLLATPCRIAFGEASSLSSPEDGAETPSDSASTPNPPFGFICIKAEKMLHAIAKVGSTLHINAVTNPQRNSSVSTDSA